MTWVLLGLVALLALVFVATRWGMSREREKVAKHTAKVKDKQLEAAINSPRTKSELLDRLRGPKKL